MHTQHSPPIHQYLISMNIQQIIHQFEEHVESVAEVGWDGQRVEEATIPYGLSVLASKWQYFDLLGFYTIR